MRESNCRGGKGRFFSGKARPWKPGRKPDLVSCPCDRTHRKDRLNELPIAAATTAEGCWGACFRGCPNRYPAPGLHPRVGRYPNRSCCPVRFPCRSSNACPDVWSCPIAGCCRWYRARLHRCRPCCRCRSCCRFRSRSGTANLSSSRFCACLCVSCRFSFPGRLLCLAIPPVSWLPAFVPVLPGHYFPVLFVPVLFAPVLPVLSIPVSTPVIVQGQLRLRQTHM